MQIEQNKLIIDGEITDEMLEELIEKINNQDVQIIELNTNNISSLALQQLFCIDKEKTVQVNDLFMAKFFENIIYV